MGSCRCAPRRQGPGAAMHGLAQGIGSCRRVPRQQGLNVVGYDGRSQPPWASTPDVHLSKILIRPFIFQKSWKNKYKKIPRTGQEAQAQWRSPLRAQHKFLKDCLILLALIVICYNIFTLVFGIWTITLIPQNKQYNTPSISKYFSTIFEHSSYLKKLCKYNLFCLIYVLLLYVF
jgi:hypothetical protein